MILFTFMFSEVLKSHHLTQVYTSDCFTKGMFDDQSKGHFSNSLLVVKPVIWHLHTEAGSLCVPLVSQSEPHRKSDSSLQRETKKTLSFIFHNLELFKSLRFLFLFLPITASRNETSVVKMG